MFKMATETHAHRTDTAIFRGRLTPTTSGRLLKCESFLVPRAATADWSLSRWQRTYSEYVWTQSSLLQQDTVAVDVSHKPATVCVHFSKIATLPNSSAPLVDLERKKKKKRFWLRQNCKHLACSEIWSHQHGLASRFYWLLVISHS